MSAPIAAETSFEKNYQVPDNAIPGSMLDVALALVLNEIAHQARSMTNATGSAVLLIRGGVRVYRSTSGVTAGDASTYLSERTEHTDLSWRKGAPQRCNDVETDRRFDLALCRRLGLRSFLIVPVQDDRKSVVAVVETFSARPESFSDRDLLALQGLGRHIIDHMAAAERTFGSSSEIGARNNVDVRPVNPAPSSAPRWSTARKLPILHERLNLALGVMILVLAMLLGWTIGRSERENAHPNKGSTTALVNTTQTKVRPAEQAGTTGVQVSKPSAENSGPSSDAPVVIAKQQPSPPGAERQRNHLKPRHSLPSKSMPISSSSDELVIFESGSQVFPRKSARSQVFTGNQNDENKPGDSRTKDKATPVSISEEVAQQHLLNRVEPEYPEYAREQRLQGTVILNVNVDKDGTVRGLSRVTGESQLVLLAAKAVRQWRFSPLVRNGAPVSFESQVTLSFVLP